MAYSIDSGIWSSVFAVPSAIVDEHIKMCSPLALRVLLVMLRHSGQAADVAFLSKKLGSTPDDIRDALAYWISAGIVRKNDVVSAPAQEQSAAAPQAAPKPAAPAPVEPYIKEQKNDGQKIVTIASRMKMTQDDIVRLTSENPTISQLLQEAQVILGAPLTPVESEIITALCAYYHMPYDVVLMLLQYCVSTGRRSMHAVEKMAASWLEQGIDTFERAEQEILRLAQASENEAKAIAAFGEIDRNLTAKEKAIVADWFASKTDEKLIFLACELTLENTGKVSFPYADKVLSGWKSSGIKSVDQAVKAMKEKQTAGQKKPVQNASAKTGGASSIDMEKLKSLLHYQPDEDE